jgi:signal transduction histidine kinase
MSEQSLALTFEGQSTETLTLPRLEGRLLTALRIGWIVLAVLAAIILITSIPGYGFKFSGQLAHVPSEQASGSTGPLAAASGIASIFAALLSYGLAVMLYRRRFEEPAAAALSFYLVIYSVLMAGPLEHWGEYWLGSAAFATSVQSILLATPTIALFALFPNGKIVPDWMRWILILSLPWTISLVLLGPISGSGMMEQPLIYTMAAVGFVAFLLLGIYAQIYRYRRVSTLDEQQQTKWVVFGFALWFIYMLISTFPYMYLTSLPPGAPVPWWAGLSELGWWLSMTIVPISLTIAITRYRLWNFDLVINRTLVYGALAISLVVIYVLMIAGLGLLFQSSESLLIPLLATGVAILVFQPLRARLQGAVNRMMYGERDDPAVVLTRLGEQLEQTATPEATLQGIVHTVAQTLKLPYVAIELGEAEEIIASHGTAVDVPFRLPLRYQGQIVGGMLVAPRSADWTLGAKDQQLLESIARQAGAVAYTAHLTGDLIRARQRLVSAREEERRRIRRDLHDGLGPQLASLSLKLDAARNLLESRPDEANRLLSETKEQVQDAVKDIRRLVYNLRPPTLDELGLMSALRERAATYGEGQGPHIYVEGPEKLPSLPAAVEVAAYRIIQEAVNNAAQHGEASHCWIQVELDTGLSIDIIDDGVGFVEGTRAGVGITSMRERTDELGGSFRIDPGSKGGTSVQAWLPIDSWGSD